MGIAERKEREKQKLRDKILSAATELFLGHGFEKASMRMIADRIEYSPATLYLHFKDKNELFFAISERAFHLFFTYLSSVNDIEDPLVRLKALGRAYLKFAEEHPAYYDLMFIMRAPMEAKGSHQNWSGEMSHQVLIRTVQDCMVQGHFQGHDLHALSLTIWSSVHGMASLHLRDRLGGMYPTDSLEQLQQRALESLDAFLDKS